MLSRHLFFSLLVAIFCQSKAQAPAEPSLEALRDTIVVAADSTINAQTGDARLAASYRLIGLLKKTIKSPGSYSYSLAEIPGIIEVRQEEDEFRILSWQVQLDEDNYRYFGVIQFHADTGKFIPLIDYSDMYKRPEMVVVTPDRWLGMAYYGIKTVKSGKKTYYTLFGYDAYNSKHTRKYVDVMWWDKDTLRFGAPIFQLPNMP
ncbi:MAG TPA: hypothetical protein VEB42_09215, partial [Chitinophagaceae bacterium]|nr:hypothetical protein [Chitinophagaceae bacterium]